MAEILFWLLAVTQQAGRLGSAGRASMGAGARKGRVGDAAAGGGLPLKGLYLLRQVYF